MCHPTENETTNEWIELFNPTEESIDVSGWMIADEKETDTLQADSIHGDGTTSIPPGGYALITDIGTTVYETFTVAGNAITIIGRRQHPLRIRAEQSKRKNHPHRPRQAT